MSGRDGVHDPPHPQPGPIAFLVVCVLGMVAALRGVLTLRIGTEQWWVGVLGLAVVLIGFVVIEGGWVAIQREVAFLEDRIVVRRWIEILIGRPGRVVPLDGRVRAWTTSKNVRTLWIRHDTDPEVAFTIGYWEASRVAQLLVAFSARGIVVSPEA